MARQDDEWGIVTRVSWVEDEQGRQVLRATVDFYDGNFPDITFDTVWKKARVKIVLDPATDPSAHGAVTCEPETVKPTGLEPQEG